MRDCDDEFVVNGLFLEWIEKVAGLYIQRGRHAIKNRHRHLALCLWVQVPRLQKNKNESKSGAREYELFGRRDLVERCLDYCWGEISNRLYLAN